MKLQVICRGSIQEGLGHLFRTRTFVKTAEQMCDIEILAIVEAELEVVLSELTCPVHFVRHDDDILSYIYSYAPDILLFDLIHIEAIVFQKAIAIPALTVSLSPVFEHMSHIDILFTRVKATQPIPGVQIFSGLEYAIFNDHGTIIDDATYEQNLALAELPVAVCMGGTDAANKTLAVLQALVQRTRATTIWVLLGEGYAHSYNALVDTVKGNCRHEVILAKTNRSMWKVMSNCVLAILAGGLTTIEALYAGLPTINLLAHRSHSEVMQELFDMQVCMNSGLFSAESLQAMADMVEQFDHNRDTLRIMRQRSKGIIDARGSERVLYELQRQLENIRT